MSILWSPLKIWTPKNFTTANFRHPVSKSWLRHCRKLKLKHHENSTEISICHVGHIVLTSLPQRTEDCDVWWEYLQVMILSETTRQVLKLYHDSYQRYTCMCIVYTDICRRYTRRIEWANHGLIPNGLIPNNLRQTTLREFNNLISTWSGTNCTCSLSAAINNTSKQAGVSAILHQKHKHMSWKTEDITHCQLMCANLLTLYLSFILLLHRVIFYIVIL